MDSIILFTRQHPTIRKQFFQATAVLWGAATLVLTVGLIGSNKLVQIAGFCLGTLYVLSLIGWLCLQPPYAADLPDSKPIVPIFASFRAMLLFVVGITAVFIIITCGFFGDGWLMLLFSILLALFIVLVWHKRLNRRLIIISIGLVAVLAVVEQLLGTEQSSGLLLPIGTAIMFLAGSLLLDQTQLTHIRLLDGDYLGSAKSFLWGCVLAVPPAVLNAVSMQWAAPSAFDLLFDQAREAFYALQPALVEEIWARLLLTTLIYALLRPTCRERPWRALLTAMVLAAVIHGLAHYPTSITNIREGIYISLMYGVPLVLLYVKRDLETAVAYHFFVDFVRFAIFIAWNTTS